MYLLLALSVFSITAMTERAIYFFRKNVDADELGDQLMELLGTGDHEGAHKLLEGKSKRSVEAETIAPALKYLDACPEAVEDEVMSQFQKTRMDMERGTNLLGTLGNNAPFIGLFGTVIGVIIAFQQLSNTKGAGNMGNVMAGIAEALIATGVGLFVAIPAVVAYNIIQKRIADIESNVNSLTKRITAHLKAEAARAEHAHDRGRVQRFARGA